MGLFEQFKLALYNAPSDVTGFTFTNSGSGGSEVKATAVDSATFDGWNGTAYANTNDSDNDALEIHGFAKIRKSTIKKFKVGRAIVGQVQKTKLKVAGSGVVAGSTAVVRLKLKSSNLESEFAKFHPEYFVEKRYQVTFNTTLNYVEFLKDLKALVDKDVELGFQQYITAELYDNTNVVNTAAPTSILFTSTVPTIDFDVFVELPTGLTLTFIADKPALDTDGPAVIVQESYEGRGVYEQLRHMILETDGNIYPYSEKNNKVPVKGAKYVEFYIEMTSSNTEVGNDIVGQQPTNTVQPLWLYLKEGDCTVLINNISRFLDMSTAPGEFWTGSTVATVGTVTNNATGGATIEVAEFIPVP